MAKKRVVRKAAKGAKKSSPKAPAAKRAQKRAAAAAASSAAGPLVVYIHGIGPKPLEPALKEEWDLALFGKLMGTQTRFAYWADILHKQAEPIEKAVRRFADKPMDVDQLLKAAGISANNKKARQYVENLLADAAIPLDVSAQANFRRRALPLPGFLRRPITRAFLKWFVTDTAKYFFDSKTRNAIKRRLTDVISEIDEPFILVSHSQGTIVAFEVLSELPKSQADRVSLLVTLGSPLGLQEVQDQFDDSGIAREIPAAVRAWHNFADRFDPVALDATLADDYEERDGVEVVDHLIVNRSIADLRDFSPHDSAGYLSHPEVRKVVHRAAQFDTLGRFVLARDVAERFVDRTIRQPVLIEVLESRYPAVGESYGEAAKREDKDQVPTALSERVEKLAQDVRAVVKSVNAERPKEAEREAQVYGLRKYVSARLTPSEIQHVAANPADFNVYAMWRSATKRKVLDRSHIPMGADAARQSYEADGRGITWAVLDTGCQWTHPHFNVDGQPASVIDVFDCTGDESEPKKITVPKKGDPDGHGSHVTGIIAGSGEEGTGASTKKYFGVAPRAQVVVYKVLNDDGEGSDDWIIKAIDHIYRRNQNASSIKIHGVNLSLGGPFDATVYGCGFSPLCKELRDLWQQGVVVCVAAGNEGQLAISTADGDFDLNTLLSIGDPANLQECIAVGSSHADKPHIFGVSYFSSRGPTADGRMKPDVVAPGERIFSCNSAYGMGGAGSGKIYREESGTSMACPHVSGLIAAFLSARREFIGRPDDVKKILLENCNDLGRDRYHQGAGMPNLMKMLINT